MLLRMRRASDILPRPDNRSVSLGQVTLRRGLTCSVPAGTTLPLFFIYRSRVPATASRA